MNGYLNILKPPGMTSSNVVGRVRYNLHMKKVGHAGTLDPGAVGVLPVMLGKATKMFDYLNLDRKIYTAEFTFGVDTNTLDFEGEVTNKSEIIPTIEQITKCITGSFLGEILQVPPRVSAISINGHRAYDLARQGKEFTIAPRQVTIYSFDLIRQSSEKSFMLTIECSKGTYIRSLCRDLAKVLETYAYVSYLSREKSGFFEINNAITLEQLEIIASNAKLDEYIIPIDAPLGHFERIDIPIVMKKVIINGGKVKVEIDRKIDNIRVYCGGDFIGIGQVDIQYLKIKKMFYE